MNRFTVEMMTAKMRSLFPKEPIPAQVLINLKELLRRVNPLLDAYVLATGNKVGGLSSGYRNPEYNTQIKGARKSAHVEGKAIDIFDYSGRLKGWLKDQIALKRFDLWMESEEDVSGWLHVDYKAGRDPNKRIFRA